MPVLGTGLDFVLGNWAVLLSVLGVRLDLHSPNRAILVPVLGMQLDLHWQRKPGRFGACFGARRSVCIVSTGLFWGLSCLRVRLNLH